MRYVDIKKCEMEVIECDCGYHMGFDTTYMDQVGDIVIECPSCASVIDTGKVDADPEGKKLAEEHKNKMVEVFLLANNYHSISGSDMDSENVSHYLSSINTEWDAHRIELIQNGWDEISVEYITSEDKAREIAWQLLNKKENNV